MPERLECEVLQKAHNINTLTFTFNVPGFFNRHGSHMNLLLTYLHSGKI